MEKCWICHKSDHRPRKCPQLAKEDLYPGTDKNVVDKKCHGCGKFGHIYRFCPGERKIAKLEKERMSAAAKAAKAKQAKALATRVAGGSSKRHICSKYLSSGSESESETETESSSEPDSDETLNDQE